MLLIKTFTKEEIEMCKVAVGHFLILSNRFKLHHNRNRKVSALEDIDDATSERVLLWTQTMEAQRVQEEALDSIKEAKDFVSLTCSTQNMTMRPIKAEMTGKL